ncbi:MULTISPECIES: ribosome small subunit-dependent GTPase A [Gemella]|uniref:ribosome small subunit-dependent GTPase A n=1 Tax=Gemella TaxID=1378 RepID=UPI000767ED81|nr:MULTISPECIES: ribosome small subunit-dependent GTPase A [Gemella]AME09425.1 ribosome small subunit-dependent GTPase [Gemella sp. oral taxon 928]AXI27061.1 ribosome small subunit-dependent GTPase A [Gemella sp. ND 6198]
MTKKGKILKALSGFYYVQVGEKMITCRARGNFRNDGIVPLVGDNVIIQMTDNNTGYVVKILGRKNELLRPKVVNIDHNLVIISAKDPDFSSKLLNKIICLNENSNVDIILIFTKLDLLNKTEHEYICKVMKYYKSIGYKVYTNDEGDISKIKSQLAGEYIAISGQSGAGKSTFINKLSGSLNIETAEISKHLGRGRHTTRHIEFYKLDDFYIADTPGFSSIDITFIEKEDIQYLFREFSNYSCKFQPCNHVEEINCGVKEAVKMGEVLQSRYEDYKMFFKEKETQKKKY